MSHETVILYLQTEDDVWREPEVMNL